MKLEKNVIIATIALLVIISSVTGAYLYYHYVWKEEIVVEAGDCIDMNYIGKYASNGTVFDSSYSDVENRSGGTPLKVFVSLNELETPPAGYQNYSAGIIEGLMEGLIDSGLKEGEPSTVGPIPPEKAYGANKLKIGDVFNTSSLAMILNQTVQVTNLTNENISLKWINVENFGNFTMPQMIINNLQSQDQSEMTIIPPPYSIWENSSRIISVEGETVTVKTTPTKSENLSKNLEQVRYGTNVNDILFIFPDATTASWNDTTITVTCSPKVGAQYAYSMNYYGQQIDMTFTIESTTNDTINVSVVTQGAEEPQYQVVNKTVAFNRTYSMSRLYKDVPLIYQEYLFAEDLQREGYSLNKLAGESLIFEVTIEKVYKTSQLES